MVITFTALTYDRMAQLDDLTHESKSALYDYVDFSSMATSIVGIASPWQLRVCSATSGL